MKDETAYNSSMYHIYAGKRKEVKAEMKKREIPKFSFEAFKKGVEEKEDLKDEKIRHRTHGNKYQRNELIKQFVNSPTPNWGGVVIFV